MNLTLKKFLKKNTHNFNNFSKISSENYSNSKNNLFPKADYLLIKEDKTPKNISSNFEEQLSKLKVEPYGELESSIGVNQYDLVIFSGDLNYRINMEIEDCKKLLEVKDIETLLEKDQLYSSIKTKERQ